MELIDVLCTWQDFENVLSYILQLFSTMWGMPISTVQTASKPALHCSRTKVRCAAMLGFSLPDSRSEHSVVIRNTNMLNSYYIFTEKFASSEVTSDVYRGTPHIDYSVYTHY